MGIVDLAVSKLLCQMSLPPTRIRAKKTPVGSQRSKFAYRVFSHFEDRGAGSAPSPVSAGSGVVWNDSMERALRKNQGQVQALGSLRREGWLSGLRHLTRNQAYGKPYRGFKSLPFRQISRTSNTRRVLRPLSTPDRRRVSPARMVDLVEWSGQVLAASLCCAVPVRIRGFTGRSRKAAATSPDAEGMPGILLGLDGLSVCGTTQTALSCSALVSRSISIFLS